MEKEQILVSIVIPTYSRNIALTRAIDSALAQTYKNYEIIVVDDNPPDSKWRASTEKIMLQYADNPVIRYIQNSKNLGGSGARNEGIKAARGEYIAFLDDDDEYMPEKVEKQLNCFLNTTQKKLALVFCDAMMTYDNDKFVCYLKPRYRGCCLYEAMVGNCLAATSQWMAKKEALVDVGMFTIVPCKQDSTLILKLLVNGYEVECVPEVLSKYCSYQGERISDISEKKILGEKSYMSTCRKYFSRLSEIQREQVEFAFAIRLYELYSSINMRKESRQEKRKMMEIDWKKSVRYLIQRKIKGCKYHIKKKIFYKR